MTPTTTPNTYEELFLAFTAVSIVFVFGILVTSVRAVKTKKELADLTSKLKDKGEVST